MPQKNDWWVLQFTEKTKDIVRADNQFSINREIEYLDKAEDLYEDLRAAYKISLNFLTFVKFGRACLERQFLPQN